MLPRPWLSVLCLAIAAGAFGAEPAKPAPSEWQLKTFQIQPGNSWYEPLLGAPNPFPFPSPDPDTTFADTQPLPLPSPDASDEAWEKHIEKSSGQIAHLIQRDGIEVPEGSLFLHDVASGTVVVRSTGVVLDLLGRWEPRPPFLSYAPSTSSKPTPPRSARS